MQEFCEQSNIWAEVRSSFSTKEVCKSYKAWCKFRYFVIILKNETCIAEWEKYQEKGFKNNI